MNFSNYTPSPWKSMLAATMILLVVMLPTSIIFATSAPALQCDVVSDTSSTVQETGGSAVKADKSPLWINTIPAAMWIWKSADVANPAINDTATFVKQFTLSNVPTAAHIEIAADDGFIITVNGTVIASNNGENHINFTSTQTFDITSALVTGTNTLKVTVNNIAFTGTPAQNPAGVDYHLHADGASCTPIPITTPSGSNQTPVVTPPAPTQTTIVYQSVGGLSGGSTGGTSASAGQVLGASTTCGEYLTSYIKLGAANDATAVSKLQTFLNNFLHIVLHVDGVYGNNTFTAVKQFQTKESDQVLLPWKNIGYNPNLIPTGYVYKTTQREINNLVCPSLNLPMPQLP